MNSSIRTLLADDSAEFLRVLAGFLGSVPGLELIGRVGDGDSALREVAALAPDLLIIDLMMPGRSGIDVTLRLQSVAPRPKIIVLTMHSASEYREAAFAYGADAYVCKTNLVSELPQAIRQLFPSPAGG